MAAGCYLSKPPKPQKARSQSATGYERDWFIFADQHDASASRHTGKDSLEHRANQAFFEKAGGVR